MSHRVQSEKFPHHKTLLLGIVISVLGLGCIIQAIVGFTLHVWGYYIGTGLWCGTVIFAAGVSGIISSHFRGSKSVKWYFVCSAIAAVMSLVMIVMSSAGLDYNSKFYKNAAYFKVTNKKSTFYCYVAALTLSLLSLVGNIASLFFCAQQNSFYDNLKKSKRKSGRSSSRRSHQGSYSKTSSNSRSALRDGAQGDNTSVKSNNLTSHSRENTLERRDKSKHHKHVKRSVSDRQRHKGSSRQTSCDEEQRVDKTVNKTSESVETKVSNRDYRSLPNRSKRHHRHRPSYDAELGTELLPTAFNEDELPSYSDAVKQPPLVYPKQRQAGECSTSVKHPPTPQLINGDSQVIYRHHSSTLPKHQNHEELHQNRQNEEVEMYKQITSRDTSREINDFIPRNKFIQPQSLPNNSQLQHCANININILSNASISVPDSHATASRRAFTPLEINSDPSPSVSLPITIGSPRSAFRPVKRRSSQKEVENCDEETDVHLIHCSSDMNTNLENPDNANVWKNIVLPTLLNNETTELEIVNSALNVNGSVEQINSLSGIDGAQGASACVIEESAERPSQNVNRPICNTLPLRGTRERRQFVPLLENEARRHQQGQLLPPQGAQRNVQQDPESLQPQSSFYSKIL